MRDSTTAAPSAATQTLVATAAPAAQRRAWLTAAAGLGGMTLLSPLVGCATPPATEPADETAAPASAVPLFSAAPAGALPAGWRPYAMRRDLKPTRYVVVQDGAHKVLHARAAASATGLRCAVRIDPARFGSLRFSWRVREAPVQADVGVAEYDDCPARLILAFGGDDARLPMRDRLFFEQVELFTGQRLPFATLMYVWDGGTHALESVHRNHRSARIQYLTVESGAHRCGHWLYYERDIVADYQRVFGELPGPVIGVGVLTDADALKTDLEAWYGDITLSPQSPQPPRLPRPHQASAASTG